jgi:hypothetical protein
MYVSEKPEKTEIVKPSELDHFKIFEVLDEEQIRSEIQGAFVRDMVYQFRDSEGRLVTGLSYAGVKELLRFMVRHGYDIRFSPAEVEEHEKEFRARCKVTYVAPNGKVLEAYGYSRALKYIHTKDGKTIPNEFAYVLACSKAQRNAGRVIIPERAATKMIELFLQRGQVREIKPEEVAVIKEAIVVEEPTKEAPKPEAPKQEAPKPEAQKAEVRWHTIKWTVKGEEFPIPAEDRRYLFLKNNVIKGIANKHGVKFEEEIVAGNVVEIRATDMDEKLYSEFEKALNWVLRTINNCPKEDVKIWVED